MKRLGNLHSGKFPFIELSASAMGLRALCREKGAAFAMSLHKDGNKTVAIFCVEGADNIRRAHDSLFNPTTRREQRKAETDRIQERIAKFGKKNCLSRLVSRAIRRELAAKGIPVREGAK